MKFSEYQEASRRTMNSNLEPEEAMANWGLGLAGEAGEVVELLKKHVFHAKAANLEDVKKELGDVLWYVAAIASEFNIDLGEVAEANVEKLKKRYPTAFTPGGGIRD